MLVTLGSLGMLSESISCFLIRYCSGLMDLIYLPGVCSQMRGLFSWNRSLRFPVLSLSLLLLLDTEKVGLY